MPPTSGHHQLSGITHADGAHALDAGAYCDLIARMADTVPDMPVQITTEAAGRFSPGEQRAVVLDVSPEGASVVLREMWPEGDPGLEAKRFYWTCAERGIAVQHIAFTPEELARLLSLAEAGDIPMPLTGIFVLGAYAPARSGQPGDLDAFLAVLDERGIPIDWAVCAFGAGETACLLRAHERGGKIRIGSENNFHHVDGRLAKDNADRVAAVVSALGANANGARA